MKREEKDRWERELGIKRTDSLFHYLGMPPQVGRKKGVAFMRIRDKVEKILQGWKEKLFSLGGKEVLIKAEGQAIPTYTMNCFRLPISICNEIDRLCARFWWGSVGGKNKHHWISWRRMCKMKVLGFMP